MTFPGPKLELRITQGIAINMFKISDNHVAIVKEVRVLFANHFMRLNATYCSRLKLELSLFLGNHGSDVNVLNWKFASVSFLLNVGTHS